ncbi:efflux RND transporter periplasmic adaptor subunit [bacterium]|nr:MAG: efflux RND transporter periplasmic adaptor subunit [bacterium]
MNSKMIAVLALGALTACGSKLAQPQEGALSKPGVVDRPAVAVRTQPLRRMPLQGMIESNGQVAADAGGQAALAFAGEGRIAQISVNVGDAVTRGQVLAVLDGRIARSAIQQAQADVDAAQANLAKVELRARPQEVAQNVATLQAARAKEDSAKAELDRQEALAQAGISSQRDVQQARTGYVSALADLRVAEEQGSILHAGPRRQDVDVARAAVLQAQAALAAARTKATLLAIVAPFNGVITQRMKNPGETADPTVTVLAMVNPQHTVVDLQLSQDQAELVRVGEPAVVTLDGDAHTIAGRVVAVSPALASDTRTLTVRVRPQHAALTLGAAVKVSIVVRSIRDEFVVPDSAVVKDPETGSPRIYLAEANGRYRAVPVRIMLESDGRMAIGTRGVRSGERVVTRGAYELLPFSGGAFGD